MLLLAVLTAFFVLVGDGNAGQTKAQKKPRVHKVAHQRETCPYARLGLAYYRGRFIHWQIKRDSEIPTWRKPRNCADARYLSNVWSKRALAARKAYRKERKRLQFQTLYEKWRCIHEHEGAWNSNTGNGYYGGLQMDTGFMHDYGREFIARWGYAHNWPVWAQLAAAERAYHSGRGFGPWPNTRRMCGV